MARLRLFPLWLLLALAGSPALFRNGLLAENPDAACAGCHREIYDSYQRTPMAQASGAVWLHWKVNESAAAGKAVSQLV
jgi:hypothetical protein